MALTTLTANAQYDTQSMYEEVNRARSNPQGYMEWLGSILNLSSFPSIGPLERDEHLEWIATIRCKDIAAQYDSAQRYTHYHRYIGKDPRLTVRGKTCCELIYGAEKYIRHIIRQYVYSTRGHREAILSPKFKKIGIATLKHNGLYFNVVIMTP